VTQQTFRFSSPGVPPRRRNVVIEAGAGTGKTTAIVAEVLGLLLSSEELLPERIVLMTFTEKAAGEIADRIHAALAEVEAQLEGEQTGVSVPQVVWPVSSPQPLFEVPPDQRERYRQTCRKQLERIDGLRSQTIHSFCQSLLRMHPIEAGLDPQFRIIEGFERSLLYGQLYEKWADHETRLANDPRMLADWEALLEHAGYLFRIRDFVFSLAARRDLLDDDSYTIGGIDEIAAEITGAVSVLSGAPSVNGGGALQKIIEYVKRVALPPPSLDAWIEYFAPIAAEIRSADLPQTKALSTVKNAMQRLRGGRKGQSIHDALVSHRAAVALLSLTRRFISFLDQEKHLLGVADFDDLLLRAAALLDDPQIAERVRRQFDYIFVDEFQDTDRTQARVIERLAADRSGAWIEGRTLIVGDPKQSIYGFRRADPETYRRFAEELTSNGAEHRFLEAQYRSHPELVGAFNAMFARVFANSGFDANVFRPPYKELRAAGAGESPSAPRITFLHAPIDDRDRHISEAEAIAQWILARGGDLRQYAILFRRLSKLDHYLDTFDRYGIDYVLPPTRAFLDRRAPVDMLAVLRAIAYPFDRGAEISAARTPYFALTDEEIAEGIIAGAAPWVEFQSRLEQYRNESKHLTISATIDLIVESSGIESIYEATADHRRALRHLEHLRSIAFTYDQKSNGSLRQFVAEIDRRRNEPDEMEPSLADDDSNAVRILSAHAAKGLEFDTVILPDLSFPLRGNDSLQVIAVEDPRSLVITGSVQTLSAQFRFTNAQAPLKDVGREREEAEMRRLFYVAVTRAKSGVVFVCNPAGKREGFLACLTETFGLEKTLFETMWPAGGGLATVPLRAAGRIVPALFEKLPPGETGSVQRMRLRDRELEQRMGSGDLAPLELPPLARTIETLTAADAAIGRAAAANRAGGILLHRLLELWDGDADIEPLMRSLVTESGAETQAITTVRRRLRTLRRSPAFDRIVRGETIARELPIRFVDENGAVVERRIDRILRENGREVVVDYKSGTPDQDRLTRDRDQVTRYCAAVQRMTGRPCSGLLWYIDGDRDELMEVLAPAAATHL
jgi:ATP-dependent helicase/nuclease subunit A